MTLEEALRAQLVGYAPLAAIVNNRVYPLVLTENAVLPAVTYQRISTSPLRHRNLAELERVRYQIDSWGTAFSQVIPIRAHVRAALLPWQRAMSPRVEVVFLEDDRDLREPTTGRFRASQDFMLWATEDS